RTPVSILVFDKTSLDAFPRERKRLAQEGGQRRCQEGDYHMVSGITRDNLLIVIGSAPPEELERLFKAYGSYHEVQQLDSNAEIEGFLTSCWNPRTRAQPG